MKNLGAKLKAAREAMQLSLRDVADATRLRIPVLEKMEDGSFDYDLQDVYKRGFLRIYAAFLKLNVDDVMREYNTAMAMRRSAGDSRRGLLVAASVDEEQSQATSFDDAAEENRSDVDSEADLTAKYVKFGGLLVLGILSIVVVVMIVSSITKNSTDAVPESASNAAVSAINDVSVEPAKLFIEASGDTYVTVAKAANQSDVVFTGALKAGQSKDFALTEPLFVRATDASKIKMKRGNDVIYDKAKSGVVGFRIMPR